MAAHIMFGCLEASTYLRPKIVLGSKMKYSVHSINAKREDFGEYHHVSEDFKKDVERFQSYYRMHPQTFSAILDIIRDDLQKEHGKPISPEERLTLTLRFLSTGMSYRALAFSFRMGRSTVAKIIEETMSIIWKRLKPIYVKQPSKDSCIDVAEKFQEKCNFPNVIGAVDGKHVSIMAPPNSGSNFFNYKCFFSIVLQGVADSDLKFVAAEVGAFGKESGGGIFSRSQIKRVLSTNTVQLPVTAQPLLGTDIVLPYILIGDAAYPLQPYCMTPISSHLTYERCIFNYRHSRARRCIECAFGALAAKWRVLKTTIETRLETAEMIVLASVALHNAIICLEGIETSEADIEDWDDSSARNAAGCLPQNPISRTTESPRYMG